MERKKKILYQSDFSLAKSGFGRCAKALLTYLYNTGKYEICHYSCGNKHSDPQLSRTPWRSVGTLPDDPKELQRLQADPSTAKTANYGALLLDKVVKNFEPDIYIAAQDIWGIDFALSKPWYNSIKDNVALWTTLDSRPILPTAVKAAHQTSNYWIWSDFATKELHSMGLDHVRTMHGPVDTKYFGRLPDDVRKNIRLSQDIPQDAFIIGFVFRNQLRKSVPNLLEGYSLFKKWARPNKPMLLLHTSLEEGWNIASLAKQYGVPTDEIIISHVCENCGSYSLKKLRVINEKAVARHDCGWCNSKNTCRSTGVGGGVTEPQLNDIYNVMDVYCHPFTSGGQEYPIQEAKLTELITLVTNYSCGEEMCAEDAQSLPLEWSEYREHGTEFIKASTSPKSIAKQLQKVYKMKPLKKREMESKARAWALKNYSINVIGSDIEKWIDSKEFIDWSDIDMEVKKKNPSYEMPKIDSDKDWLTHAYHNILSMSHVDEHDEGHKHWMLQLEQGAKREDVEAHFKSLAERESGIKEFDIKEFLDKDSKAKRILYVMPENTTDVFLSTSLFKSIKEQYPEHDLYLATKQEFFSMVVGNPYVHKLIPYIPLMNDLFWAEGIKEHSGHFDICFLPHISTRQNIDYTHNGLDKIAFDIKCT